LVQRNGEGCDCDGKIVFGGFAIEALAPDDCQVRAVVSSDGKPAGRVTRTLRKVAGRP
jgi:hypothetical protein